MAIETGLDEIKASRDHYRREIEEAERRIVSYREKIDSIREQLPKKQRILDELNEFIERWEGK